MELFYRKLGQGKPVIILHGFLEMSDAWLPLARSLAIKYQVIIPDLRNHGQSPHSPHHSCSAMAQDVIELTDKLQISSYYLIGYSMGGRVAMNITEQIPKKIKKLIVIDIAPNKYKPEEIILQQDYFKKLNDIFNIDLSLFSNRKQLQQEIMQMTHNPIITNLIIKNIKLTPTGFQWKPNIQALKNYINNLRTYPIDIHKEIYVPTLFIKAEKSSYITEKQIDLIKKIFKYYQLIEIKNTTHLLPVEKPKELIEAVDNFLK